ncbi:MAG TPA: tetratricopeptide repeat protein [Thermoanaerobaculia bacterium]|nr:tetratricopeptide repeat protein [Thermoanaerobaculia bacterium]
MRRPVPARALVALLVLVAAGCAGARPTETAGAQISFGVEMAQRGLWNEALFRFEQARRAQPRNPAVLNNLAVAYEAVGRFDDALATYREALEVAPQSRGVRQNYTRFVEFYQAFQPKEPEAGDAGARDGAAGGGR